MRSTPRSSFGPPLLAFWKGGWRERLVGAVYGAGAVYNALFMQGRILPRAARGGADLIEDAALLLVCVICLRKARGYWLVWAGAFALLSVVTDALYLARPGITALTFISADNVWTYGVAAALAWGALTRGALVSPPAQRDAL